METRFDWWVLWAVTYLYLLMGIGIAYWQSLWMKKKGRRWPASCYMVLAVVWPVIVAWTVWECLKLAWRYTVFLSIKLAEAVLSAALRAMNGGKSDKV